MAKASKLSRTVACRARRHDQNECDEEADPGAFFGEVETIDEIAPTMLALLRTLPSGTRVYLRLKRTVH